MVLFLFACICQIIGSHEQSPHLADSAFHYECQNESDVIPGPDSQLREDLADAMKDDPSVTGKHFEKYNSHFDQWRMNNLKV